MNFPHKKLEWTAVKEGAAIASQVADHRTLFAESIARQASSRSARDYIAASKGCPNPGAMTRGSFMDDRMAFFAGRVRSDMAGHDDTKLFGTGCFRPDLAYRQFHDGDG
ncbi:MAG: hypothetical protein WBM39_04345 [Parasphingorhabdus sp.]